jgi:hypothetical protein
LNKPTMSAPVGTTAAAGAPGALPASESPTAITGTTPGLSCWSTAAIANIELPDSARAIVLGRTVWASLLPAMNADWYTTTIAATLACRASSPSVAPMAGDGGDGAEREVVGRWMSDLWVIEGARSTAAGLSRCSS